MKTTTQPGHEAPMGRWLAGTDGLHTYLVHLHTPVFLCKVADDNEGNVLSAFSYMPSDGRSLYDFLWFDDHPGPRAVERLMREAEAAFAVLRSHLMCRHPECPRP